MHSLNACALFIVLRVLTMLIGPAGAVPVSSRAASTYWMADIKRQGVAAYGDRNHRIFRNVRDFGARGDGVTDDTQSINNAISAGARCGQNCDSNTITPAIVYFPPGTYVVSRPIIQYYYTQLIGDAIDRPVLQAAPGFEGIGVIDSDPYVGPVNWYGNTNNFFRQIRNFVIDLQKLDMSTGTGLHWQVAQATSLQNIWFKMVENRTPGNKQQGIFMDNGSGGFMTDLLFTGGNYGAFVGNQQFTTRNLSFRQCNTAIFMNWNWAWTFKSVNVDSCNVGLDIANNPSNQNVGSAILMDSKITNTPVGVRTAYSDNSAPPAGGTLVLDNVEFNGVQAPVQSHTGGTILQQNGVVESWVQGSVYTGSQGHRTGQPGENTAHSKPAGLLSGTAVFEKSKPQYESYPSSSFISVKDNGAKGDGASDDTRAIQSIFDSCRNGGCDGKIIYFDHGAYVISDTITIPGDQNIKITGEIWPLIMANGKSGSFNDQSNPKPVFRVGTAGQSGSVEISDLIFETLGPAPGAIMMEWNSAGSQGANGLWDVHFRIGGTQGTGLQSNTCTKNPGAAHGANPACEGAHLLLHVTQSASVYVENCWFWVADHELDFGDHNQIDIYNGRGVLIESKQPTWWYGTSSEHSVLYNYQLNGARNVFMGMIQTETPYFQSNPPAPVPFTPQGSDPQFSSSDRLADKAWGLRIVDSSDVLVYGAGLYSFFDNYDQVCLQTESCQTNMVQVDRSSNVYLFALSTKASVNMVTDGSGSGLVKDSDNRSNFCATVALFRS